MTITESQLTLAHDLLWAREQLGGGPYDEHNITQLAEAIAKRTWLETQMPEAFGVMAQYIDSPKYYYPQQSKRRRRR